MNAPLVDLSLSGYRQVFADDFLTLDPTIWFPGLWWAAECPMPTVADSILSLKYSGSRVDVSTIAPTSPRGDIAYARSFKYGFFRARMRWTPLPGAWPAFWLIPDSNARYKGEFDVFEGQGATPNVFFGSFHEWLDSKELSSNSPNNSFSIPSGADVSNWHEYGLLWLPGRCTWTFDGVALGSYALPAVVDRQNYAPVLSLTAGVNWTEGDLTGVGSGAIELDVDFVDVWQR